MAILLAAAMSVSFAACDPKKKTPESTDNIFDRANTRKTTDTEKTTMTDIARPTETDTNTDVDSAAASSSEAVSSQIEEGSQSDTELNETEIDKTEDEIQPQPVEFAGYTLSAERVQLDNSFKVSSNDVITGELTGDTLYIMDKNKLYGYYISGTQAEKTSETNLFADYTKIDADSGGTVYLSGDNLNAAYLADDGNIYETDISGKLSLSDVSDFGLVYAKNSDNVLIYSGGETKNWTLTNMHDDKTRTGDFNMISNIEIVGDKVFVTGSAAQENNAGKLGVFNTDGELIMLSDDKTSGTGIISVTDTPNGYMACSQGALSLWNFDGSLAGMSTSGSLAQMFGTNDTITLSRLFSLNDGSVLLLCTAKTDGSDKPFLYRITFS